MIRSSLTIIFSDRSELFSSGCGLLSPPSRSLLKRYLVCASEKFVIGSSVDSMKIDIKGFYRINLNL